MRVSADAAAAAGGNGADRQYDYDLFCIGAGSGGVRASRVASGTYGEWRAAPAEQGRGSSWVQAAA